MEMVKTKSVISVLNLIINGLPSIFDKVQPAEFQSEVLNLIINGLPSILKAVKQKLDKEVKF